MPAVSKSQYKKMFALYKQGKITKKQLDDFTKGVPYGSLPGRAKKRTHAHARSASEGKKK